jgi:hypothetical protein
VILGVLGVEGGGEKKDGQEGAGLRSGLGLGSLEREGESCTALSMG